MTFTRPIFTILIIACTLLCTGCPDVTQFPLCSLDEADPVDTRLYGTWNTNATTTEVIRFSVTKKTATSYNVRVKEKGSSFQSKTTNFTGWVTKIGGSKFFVLQEINEGKASENYYAYHYQFDKDSLRATAISLAGRPEDQISSTEQYKKVIANIVAKNGFKDGHTASWGRLEK